jgi:hypothetical protein
VFQQLFLWTNGTRYKVATTIRANAVQLGVYTCNTKRAFIGIDAGVFAVGRKVTVTTFTIGSELEHGCRFLRLSKTLLHPNLCASPLSAR